MRSHAARIVLVTQLAAAVAVGHADPAPAPAGPAETRALDHLDRGVAAYRAGDYVRARSELTAASALAPDRPNPYRWLALAEAALGDCDDALVHVESFLSRVPAGDPRVPEMTGLRERCRNPGPPRPPGPPAEPVPAPAAGPPAPPPPAPESPSLAGRWWFWAAIGAVAVAAGATYELTRGSPSRLPVVTCDPAGCRP